MAGCGRGGPNASMSSTWNCTGRHRQRNERFYANAIATKSCAAPCWWTPRGAKGQVNGRGHPAWDSAAAHPVRITATARVGDGEVIDIEREVKLGGPIHPRARADPVVLRGLPLRRPGHLSLRASLVSSNPTAGSKATALLLPSWRPLLSAIAGVPLRQSVAVSGSVNPVWCGPGRRRDQRKIEGFFDICAARGLSGEQGMLIPSRQCGRSDAATRVVDAARAGRWEYLGRQRRRRNPRTSPAPPAGKTDEKGETPAGSFKHKRGRRSRQAQK